MRLGNVYWMSWLPAPRTPSAFAESGVNVVLVPSASQFAPVTCFTVKLVLPSPLDEGQLMVTVSCVRLLKEGVGLGGKQTGTSAGSNSAQGPISSTVYLSR